MAEKFSTPEQYIMALPEERQEIIKQLREDILNNLPDGFEETMSYNMIAYVVPHRLYPDGYHADPKQPLPFISLASQKSHIALYHMGIYAMPELHDWFVEEYPQHCSHKLDMGKSCIRFKKLDDIPYSLIGELVRKVKPQDWIEVYENKLKR